jgi:2-octaprenyl-6-methoxyphenol hydroxylase
MNTQSVDILITGGGMVGATMALVLSQSLPQLNIAIVEAVEFKSELQPSFDSRSIAIAHGSKQLLDTYGLWAELQPFAEPIEHIQVSDRGHIGKCYIEAEQFNLNALGYVLEVKYLGQALQQRLSLCPNVSWFCPNKVIAIEQQSQQVTVTLSDHQQLIAKLMLVADGGQSTTVQLVNIDNQQTDYQQTAIIANVQLGQPHHQWAYERFTSTGPLALLPLAENRYSLVWCVPPKEAKQLLDCNEADFIERLQQAFGYRAGIFTAVSKRVGYPLTLAVAQTMVSHRIALVGNSSHTIHPIAGQGFNLGLRDIEVMRQVLSTSDELGGYPQLASYQKLRQPDLQRVITMTDSLVRLFSNDSRLIAFGRSVGLLSMQLCDGLKQPLASQGLGYKF